MEHKEIEQKSTRLIRLCAFLVIAAIFTTLTFEAIHKGHEQHCHEDACPVCFVLQIIHNTKKISDITPVTSVEFTFFTFINFIIFAAALVIPVTLVSQKVKLSI